MLRVGLTGGIACGKSYTLREFEKLGVYPIDADEIAHQLIEPDGAAYGKVIEAFGPDIVGPEQKIDRKKLGNIIFSNHRQRETLNAILHPYILEEEERRLCALEYELSNVRPSISMTDAALMVEAGSYRKYDVLIVVYCEPEVQLRRLVAREGISEREALQRITSQMPILEKIKYGDYVIENSGKLSNTLEQIHQTYAELGAQQEQG